MSLLALPFLGAPVNAEQDGDGTLAVTACDQSGAKVDSFEQRADAGEEWRNGDIIDGLVEGGVVLEKVELSRLAPGPHELAIDYAYQRDGIYAFDQLTGFSFGRGAGNVVDGTPAPSNNPNEVVHRATVSWTQPADSEGQTITFSAHLASEAKYGAGLGAGSIAGSPFHVTVAKLDCVAEGKQTNQVKVDKPTPPQPELGTLTAKKVDDATGKAIDIATFQLWDDVNGNKALDPSDTRVGTTKSTSDGTATWSGLAYGDYLVEETAAPAGYTLPSPAFRAVTVDQPATTLTFRDAKKPVPVTGSITVRKHAGTTTGALIDTAKFQLWNDVNGNGTLDPADTKAGAEKATGGGTATWTELSYGKYLVQETAAPAGYTLPSPAYQPVTVGGAVTLDFVDQPKVTPPPVAPRIDLQVRKHAGTVDGTLIDTAKFQLWNDVNGNGTLDPADSEAGSERSTTGGTATWTDLTPGTYLVEETAAPAGYTLPDPAYRAVTLTAAQGGTTVVLDFADQAVPVPVQTVSLQVCKHAGSVTGPLIDTATFQLWNDVDGSGTLDRAVDKRAGGAVSTSGGAYTWTGLATGTYLVQEVKAPEDYSLPNPRYRAVTLAAADLGTTVTVDFADAQIAGVEEHRPPVVAPATGHVTTGPSYAGVQTLPQTGARERNQLLGLLGAAFVTLGGGLLLSGRRRGARR
ncbi:MAG: MSCRAMM family protein [Nocardioidaceae bacterium]